MKKENPEFLLFWDAVQARIHSHPVIVHNPYCKWFSEGRFTRSQLVDLFEQFAVFSKWFLLVQMMRLLNAGDLDSEAHARYILANELGVGIKPDGTTEDQPFHTSWAHVNWLRKTAQPLGLDIERLGNWETASPSTRKFINGLEETYGSRDREVGRGASYAIETWAAWGIGKGPEQESHNFWKQLILGLESYNRGLDQNKIPLDFFEFHFQSEKGHGDNVLAELKDAFSKPGFKPETFLCAGEKALDAIHAFWLGLNASRADHGETKKPSRHALGMGA